VDAGACFTPPNPPWCDTSCTTTIGDTKCTTGYDIAKPGCFFDAFAGGKNYCEPACNPNWPWMCPAGFYCGPQDAFFQVGSTPDCSTICPTTALDAGSFSGSQYCYCPCVGSDTSQCSGLNGDQVFCDSPGGLADSGGTCSYGYFCRPGGRGVCARVADGGDSG
jgi:hypothetical protein